MTPQERVEQAISRDRAAFRSHEQPNYEPSPADIALDLCDEDVSEGRYEGCSSELDLAASEYMALARRALGQED